MILQEVKEYVKQRKQVNLLDVAVHFDIEPEAVKGMLDFWVKKGKIKHVSNATACGGSCSCGQQDELEVYVWNSQLGNIPIQAC